jgi:hypothetical protein
MTRHRSRVTVQADPVAQQRILAGDTAPCPRRRPRNGSLTMRRDAFDIAGVIAAVLRDAAELDPDEIDRFGIDPGPLAGAQVVTFEEAGFGGTAAGIEVGLTDGSVYQLEVTRSR